MKTWRAALSKSGGIVYHLMAWRHGRLWADHIAATAQFLGDWQPSESRLLMIGTSAGYSLPHALMERFTEIRAAEPDPIARRLFSRRFPQVDVKWLDDDFLSPRNGRMSVAGIAEARARFDGHAILFCNLLGQLPVLFDEADGESFARYLADLPTVLAGCSWASYHDRVSGPWPPKLNSVEFDGAIETQELMNRFYAPLPDGQLLEFWDHQTGPLAADLPRRVWLWQRTPMVFHLVEAVSVSC